MKTIEQLCKIQKKAKLKLARVAKESESEFDIKEAYREYENACQEYWYAYYQYAKNERQLCKGE